MNIKGKQKIALLVTFALVAVVATSLVLAGPNKQCRDGIDNDGDGLVDWPADPGCNNKNDNDENNCGNALIDGTEVCDGANLGGATCSSEGFTGGTLGCQSSCAAFDTTSCYTNTCSDTDGSNTNTQGTVSGDAYGSPYSHTDSCVGGNIVLEWTCAGTSPSNFNQSCGNQTCVNGACV